MAALPPFGDGVWLADGGCVSSFGFVYPTRMAVVRLLSGELWLWSPVALTDALRAEVARLGPVGHIVAPSKLHNLAMPDWQAAFPQALLHAAPGLRARRPDIAFGSDLGAEPHPDWAGQIEQVLFRGNRIAEEAAFFHAASGTVLICDLIQHFPPGWFSGWRAVVARLDRMTGAGPAMPRKFRLAFADRAAAGIAARRVLGWPATAVVMAHGAPVTDNAGLVLARAFGPLAK